MQLITPKGGTVLDLFLGSGTTGMACAVDGYSFIGIGASLADRDALAAPGGRRIFAGEACSHDHAATVHGAYASGEAAAKAVMG